MPLTLEDVIAIANSVDAEELRRRVAPAVRGTLESFGVDMVREIAGDSAIFNVLDRRVTDFLRDFGARRIVAINDRTRGRVAESLAEGLTAGENSRKLRERVRDVFEASRSRADMIVLTETTRASNFGSLEGIRQAGIDFKEWLATGDDHTRATHAAMDGQEQPTEQPFVSPSGAVALYPGGFGVGAEDINCRCAVLPVFKEAKPKPPPGVPPAAADAPAVAWEDMSLEERRGAIQFTELEPGLAQGAGGDPSRMAAINAQGVMIEVKAIGNSPTLKEAYARMREMGVEDPKRFIEDMVAMSSSMSKTGQFTFEVFGKVGAQTMRTTFQGQGVEMIRQFDVVPKGPRKGALDVYHSWFVVPATKQGTGNGLRMLVDSFDIYERHGVARVTVTANLDVGGYAWGRLGFKAAQPSKFLSTVFNVYVDPDMLELYNVAAAAGADAPSVVAAHPRGKQLMLKKKWNGFVDVKKSDVPATLRAKLASKKGKK